MQPITGKVTKEAIEAGPKGFMKYFARRAPAMLAKRGALAATGVGAIPAAISLIPELAYMGADYFAPEATDRFEKAVGSGIKTGAETVGSGLQSGVDYLQSFMPESDYVDDRTEDEVARDNEIASQYFMNPYNNGGRVEMFRGGSMRDSGMVRGSKGYGPAGAGGQAQGPRGNQGGNQGGNGRQIQTGPSLNNINPEKKRFVQEAVMAEDMNNLMQPRPKYTAPPKEETIMDKLNRINFFEGEYGDLDDGLSFGYDINPFDETANANLTYSFADGGRVAMQQGGMSMPALLGVSSGSSGNLFNNYMPNPSAVPGPSYETLPMPNMPQYTQSMPMQDFNFGDSLGGPDPYAVTYDPYVSATGTGAYDNYGLGMTQEDIDKVFADTDKFSLAAQAAKRKAEEEAKKKQGRRNSGNDRQDAEREQQRLADARHRHRNSDNRVDGTNVGTSAGVDRANTGRTDGGFGL